MGAGTYRLKNNVEAYHFTDPCDDVDGLYEFGLNVFCITTKFNNGNIRIFLNATDESGKCSFDAVQGDYIVKETTSGKNVFKVVRENMFDQIYEPVEDTDDDAGRKGIRVRSRR